MTASITSTRPQPERVLLGEVSSSAYRQLSRLQQPRKKLQIAAVSGTRKRKRALALARARFVRLHLHPIQSTHESIHALGFEALQAALARSAATI